MKNPENIKRGRKSRSSGRAFELRVRKELEKEGWTVAKWTNNVELPTLEVSKGKLIPARHKFNPFNKIMALGTGFPDFVCFKNSGKQIPLEHTNKTHYVKGIRDVPVMNVPFIAYDVIGVECKSNGTLSKEEKLKIKWLLENKIFGKIWIAQKTKKRGEILYEQCKI